MRACAVRFLRVGRAKRMRRQPLIGAHQAGAIRVLGVRGHTGGTEWRCVPPPDCGVASSQIERSPKLVLSSVGQTKICPAKSQRNLKSSKCIVQTKSEGKYKIQDYGRKEESSFKQTFGISPVYLPAFTIIFLRMNIPNTGKPQDLQVRCFNCFKMAFVVDNHCAIMRFSFFLRNEFQLKILCFDFRCPVLDLISIPHTNENYLFYFLHQSCRVFINYHYKRKTCHQVHLKTTLRNRTFVTKVPKMSRIFLFTSKETIQKASF